MASRVSPTAASISAVSSFDDFSKAPDSPATALFDCMVNLARAAATWALRSNLGADIDAEESSVVSMTILPSSTCTN